MIRFIKSSGKIQDEQIILKQIESAQAKTKVQRFAAFLPDEVLQLHGFNQLRQVHHFVAVILRVDISGILQLFNIYAKGGLGELYLMNLNINAYIGSIIEVIRCYGGDILTIAQNDFLALWKIQPEKSMFEILHVVVVCAQVIQQLLGVYDHLETLIKLKTVIACGNVSMGIAGNDYVKRVIFISDVFDSLRKALEDIDFGDVIVTTNSWPHMLHERYTVSMVGDGYMKITKILYRSNDTQRKAFFDEKYVLMQALIKNHYQQRDLLYKLLNSRKLLTNNNLLLKFERSLPPRTEIVSAPKYWNPEHMKPLLNEDVYVQVAENQPVEYLTELRKVTVLFIKITPKADAINKLVIVVNDSLNVILDNIKKLSVSITNLCVVENEILITMIFGLSLVNHDNESSQSLKFGFMIKELLEHREHIMHVSVGISSGIVYCSVIGHPLRREHVIIGKAITKARRFTTQFPYIVTCDLQIFNTCKLSSLYFKLTKEERRLNDFNDIIFEYNERFDVTEPKVRTKPLVDRVADYNLIIGMVQDPKVVGFSGICFEGPTMIGKSVILSHAYEQMKTNRFFLAYISLTPALEQPYACVMELYAKIYDQIYKTHGLVEKIIDLPRKLVNFNSSKYLDQDIGLQKYRTLNYFRDVIQLSLRTVIIFIDNVEFIDQLSWEIIELTFPMENLRLVMAGRPGKSSWDLRSRIVLNHDIRLKEVLPMKKRHMVALVCTLANVHAVNKKLITLLNSVCEGIPGYVQCILINLINNSTLELKFCNKDNIDLESFWYTDVKASKKIETKFVILDLAQTTITKTDRLTFDMIYYDLFDSFTPFQKLVMKAASAMGVTFGRMMLMVALNYPQSSILSEAIHTLFKERIFGCASRYVTSNIDDEDNELCCTCHFEEFNPEDFIYPKYVYCKHMRFRNEVFQTVAYKRIPVNHKIELHVLYSEVLEKMEHICPSCARNPANFHAFFGNYTQFLEFCRNPTKMPNYNDYITESFESIKNAIRNKTTAGVKDDTEEGRYIKRTKSKEDMIEWSKKSFKIKKSLKASIDLHQRRTRGPIDEKYIPIRNYYDPSSCQCLEIFHVVYRDLIYHATAANEIGKIIFYTYKLGLIQMCMRDLESAVKSFRKTRELSLSQKDDMQLGNVFRQFHIGKASIALAICHLRLENIPVAKHNIMIAFRQYNIPSLVFTFKHFKFLLWRPHIGLKTFTTYTRRNNVFAWELGIAMIVCSKIFMLENNWSYAKACSRYGIVLLKSVNNNIALLLDIYCDSISIYRKTRDEETCIHIQKEIISEFQKMFGNRDVLFLNALPCFYLIVIKMHMANAQPNEAIHVGYRLMNYQVHRNLLYIDLKIFTNLCELNIYTMNFVDFADVFSIMTKCLSPGHKKGLLYHHLMAMLCLNLTGYYIEPLENIITFATEYYEKLMNYTTSDIALKLLIEIQYLRRGRFSSSKRWSHDFDFTTVAYTTESYIKLMLYQMEGFLLNYVHILVQHDNRWELQAQIEKLFEFLKKATGYNLLYKPAYLAFFAWYMILKRKRGKAFSLLKKVYRFAEKHKMPYFMALSLRMENYWKGGFLLPFESRPHVNIMKSLTYSFDQFTQFLHPYILD